MKIIPVLILFCSLHATVALPESDDKFYCNPLLLNGKIIDTEQLTLVTRGIVALAKGDPSSNQTTPVPFYIYLKRGGKIVNANSYAHNNPVLRYEISEVLKSAQAGDQLIIDPAVKSDAVGRRVITVKSTQIVPQFKWFYVGIDKKDNC